MIRFTPSNHATPAPGNVLLSEPFWTTHTSEEKVVLLCEHNEEGSFGFVLNNYVDIDVDEVMDDLPKLNARISVGGPVKNGNLYYLHTREDIAESIPVMPGVFMGGNFDQIRDMLQAGQLRRRTSAFSLDTAAGLRHSSKRKFGVGRGLWQTSPRQTSCAPTRTTRTTGSA